MTGQAGHLAGTAAEAAVERDYARRGYPAVARRWRGHAGEIDLVLQDGAGIVFVEVKKSRSFERAVEGLSQRQIGRLQLAAEEFLGTLPRGSLTEARFDVALVNSVGEIQVIENALGH
jgi:putative endonuclease